MVEPTVRPWGLAVDFGTTATAAVAVIGDHVSLLSLDGGGRMSSSVYASGDYGAFLVGKQADNEAAYALDRYESTPKRRIHRPSVRLGGRQYAPVELIAAIMAHVLREALGQHNNSAPGWVVLTHPVAWSLSQRQVLADAMQAAARQMGVSLPDPVFVVEPVAAAQWYSKGTHHDPPGVGQKFAVYDLGGGTFDVAILERTDQGYTVINRGFLDPLGGYDFDHRLFTYLGNRYIANEDADLWRGLQRPEAGDVDMAERRRQMRTSVQYLKEQLSGETSRLTRLRGVDEPVLVTREDFEDLIVADVDRTIDELLITLDECGLSPSDLAVIYRVGGASRIPLVGRKLEALGAPVFSEDDPKLVVAKGAALTREVRFEAPPPPPPPPPELPKTPIEPDTPDPLQPADAAHSFASLQESQTAPTDSRSAEPATHNESTTEPPADRTASADEDRKGVRSTRRDDAMGRSAWATVLTGSVLLTVSVVVCLLPYGQDAVPVFIRVGVSAVVGALLVSIAARSGGRGRRGWMLAGIVLVTAGIAAGLKRLFETFLEEGSLDFEVFIGGLAACSVLGVLLVAAPQWRGRPHWGAVVAFVVAGSAILATAVAIFVFTPYWRWNSASPGTVAVATGLALVSAGVVVWRRRRKRPPTESIELPRTPTGIGTISVDSDPPAGNSEGKRLRVWIGLALVAALVVAAVVVSIRLSRDSGDRGTATTYSTTPAATSTATGTPSATSAPTTARVPQTIVGDPVFRDRNNALINSIAVGDCFTSVFGGALTPTTCGAPGSQQVTRRTSNPNDCPANELALQATDTNQIVCLRDMA